jgi:hypothetical protein
MSHTFQNAYLHCMDARLQKAIDSDWKKRNLYGNTDRIAWPGTIKDFVSPEWPGYRDHMFWPLEVAYGKHGIRNFIFVQHMDCGAYGGKGAFSNEDAEWNQQKADLNEAERIVKERFSDITVEKWIIRMRGDEAIDFVQV